MTNHCTDDRPFLTAFPVTKPNGNRGAAEFSQSERLVFLGCIREEMRANEKRAVHMGQGFQLSLRGFVDCISLRASACDGAIENTAFVRSAAGLKTAFLRDAGTGKVLQAGLQIEAGVRPLTRPWVGTTQQDFPARQ